MRSARCPGQPGVLSVAQIGSNLRVLTAAGEAVTGAVRRVLADAGLQGEVATVAPNLEDVFVEATRKQGRASGPRRSRAGMNLRRLSAVMVKELRQLRRDRVTLAMIVGIPVMQLVLFGYAINLNLRGLAAGIADQAGTAGSRAVVMDMIATGVIEAEVSAVARRSN